MDAIFIVSNAQDFSQKYDAFQGELVELHDSLHLCQYMEVKFVWYGSTGEG